jgi:hypothetical protein
MNTNFKNMQKFIKQGLLYCALLLAAMVLVVACKDDDGGPAGAVEPRIDGFRIVSPVQVTGTIDQTGRAVTLEVPGGADLTAAQVEVDVPAGATVSPASGTTVNLTNPVDFTVTGTDAAGAPVTRVYTVSVVRAASVAFVGNAANIEGLEDDARAAATWASETYGDDFMYLPASQINANSLSRVKVVFYYELNATEPINLGAMGGSAVSGAISNFVRDGGQLFLAGDASQYIFNIDRVPASFGFNENATPGIEENKPADDYWGLSVVEGTTSADRTGHPLFAGVLNEEDRVYLFNAPTREVRLVWWNVGPAGGECCGNVEMVTNFEEQLKATKLASLRHVGDYFGFAAIEFGRTDIETHPSLNANVPRDFRGTVLVLANSIIGYEWEVNDGSENEYHQNIERLTENALNYLIGKYDEIN